MHFSRLRLQGFKSFVDSTDLYIQEGMTGIVGPNGCGKSNLVEALKWVMGETSPKSMRGAGMEDVIFAGTATRPARNLAEVSLELDNSQRKATAEYNNDDELLVVRKIERGAGSDYRVNGRPVRQKDVHLLFADQATGARSTSVVGQGQIDALIRAKPQDRRRILEEASGTSGLQTRRHEAELKLRAAEKNLTRVDDILGALDTQLRGLKQQVRQASRYRNLADHIRKTEASLLHLRWNEAEKDQSKAKEVLELAEVAVREFTSVVTKSTTQRTNIAAELPALRKAETAAAAIVQKLTLAREQIDSEAKQIESQIQATQQRLNQAQSDYEREVSHHHDGEAAVTRLAEEKETLQTRTKEIDDSWPVVSKTLSSLSSEVDSLDEALNALMDKATEAEAKEQGLKREEQSLLSRQATLTQRRSDLEKQREELEAQVAARPDLSLASTMVEACDTEVNRREEQATEAKKAYADAQTTQNEARTKAQEAEGKLTKLHAEAEALQSMLAQEGDEHDQIIDLITVTPGLENALAVALGEALTAALETSASMHWRDMGPLDTSYNLPTGATSLAQFIEAPSALTRSLSQIGLVEDHASGEKIASNLLPGQILVSRDGWAWRWDGLTLTPEAKTASAMRLQQRNRLAALQETIEAARSQSVSATTGLLSATALLEQCQDLDQQTRDALQQAYVALNDARDHYSKQEREDSTANAKMESLKEGLLQISQDIEEINTRSNEMSNERGDLPSIETLREEISTKRIGLAEARGQKASSQNELDRLQREKEMAGTRHSTIESEISQWKNRMSSAEQQSTSLKERIIGLESEVNELKAKPATLNSRRNDLMDQLNGAEAKRRNASDVLIAREQNLSVTEHQLKQDEASLGTAREERVRAEAAVTATEEQFTTLRERMEEKLECTPDNILEIVALSEGEELPNVFELEQRLAKHLRERDNMGPVNLRAEVESENTQEEIKKLDTEKNDLVAAIAKLRTGISQLNREARERLQEAFTHVNERFQKLFTKMFGGGQASLRLIDDEDPMNAGLEIFAAPPGKKQQILSLLSGGERTLTALALLFAVFQTNPSPICVLDEAEAALDESNIGRFCQLVKDISRETGTRFLIITHQRLTMANMDRLFGVTMSEKGVSQLVSVDLANAVALRDGGKSEQSQADTAADALKSVQAA